MLLKKSFIVFLVLALTIGSAGCWWKKTEEQPQLKTPLEEPFSTTAPTPPPDDYYEKVDLPMPQGYPVQLLNCYDVVMQSDQTVDGKRAWVVEFCAVPSMEETKDAYAALYGDFLDYELIQYPMMYIMNFKTNGYTISMRIYEEIRADFKSKVMITAKM